jgi:dTDP-4-amino-4,6-dideoxygalactose transaminase
MSEFNKLLEFEKQIAHFFGAPYALAVDCCTHGLEMCIKLCSEQQIICPKQTYISIPFMLEKISSKYIFDDILWQEYYYLTPSIIDAATLWRRNSYIPNTCMGISFHIKKHINIGRGGMILLDNKVWYERLKKMRYDGRSIYDDVMYIDDNIADIGYHYYMTPETAAEGIKIFQQKKDIPPKILSYKDYSDITQFSYFKNKYT